MAKHIINKENGIVIEITNDIVAAHMGLLILRKIESSRPIVVIMEDIEEKIVGNNNLYLNMLDGQCQVDNVVYMAKTNYPERLDARIINRQSRFDIIQEVSMPDKHCRKQYLSIKYPELLSNGQLNTWIKDTEGFSFAHIKELIIAVNIFKSNYGETVVRLKRMIDDKPNSRDFNNQPMGFLTSNKDQCENHGEKHA